MDPIQDLELLMNRVNKMREKQIQFFSSRNEVTKKQAIELEKQVDQLMIQLRKKGYDPSKYDPNYQQKTMF